ncbi:hypothetical protein PENTCL1PPCAC_12397, partial [Pristionchus entomophagus]
FRSHCHPTISLPPRAPIELSINRFDRSTVASQSTVVRAFEFFPLCPTPSDLPWDYCTWSIRWFSLHSFVSMRLHLVSLALLLLALCRPSSSATIFSSTEAKSTRISVDDYATKAKGVIDGSKLSVDATKLAALFDAIPNTLLYLILKDNLDSLPAFYKDALYNGVLCEFDDAKAAVNKVLYGTETAPADRNTEESAVGIACSVPATKTEYPCYCTDKKPLLLCLVDPIKPTGTKKTCKDVAMKALHDNAPEFEAIFNDGSKLKTMIGQQTKIGEMFPTDDPIVGKIFCQAMNPNVAELVKAVYAADASFWTQDAIVSAVLDAASGYTDETDPEVACADEEFKNSEYGKCMCPLEKGILGYCFPKMVGEALKASGYLKCVEPTTNPKTEPQPTFVAAKKPTEVKAAPVLKAPTPTTAPAPPGNDTTTDDPNGAAATSSLPLASLTAAAAMLLRQ